MASKRLEKLSLTDEGVLVLGVARPNGEYVGAPPADFQLRPGDRLIVYGRRPRLHELSTRHESDEAAHRAAKAQHRRDLAEQQERLDAAGAG